MVANSAVGVDVALNYVPQGLHARGGLVFTHTRSVLSLVHGAMYVELFAVVVATPEVSENFSTLLDRVTDHLRASNFSPVFHHKGSYVLSSSFIEAQHPHLLVLPTLPMVCEFALINLNCTSHLSQLVSPVVILEVNVNQMTHSLVDIIHVAVLQ